jgi:formyl-CoA transferase
MRITGWGSDGPLADRPAFDGSVQARSGIAWCQGDAEPELIRMFIADKITATIAAQAVTAALFERTRTGLGTTIDLPMLDSLSYFNFPDLMQNRTVIADAPIDARNLQIEANRPVRTADGWIVISPVGGRQLKATLQAIGRSDAVMHMRDAPTAHELTLRLMALCDAACPQRTTAEWMVVFDGLDVPIAPVLDLDQHLADPQVVHNRIYGTVRDSFRGDTRRARYPARFGDDPVRGATAPARNVDIAAWPTRPAAARSTEGT